MRLLEQISSDQVQLDPFPHLVIENAIDEALCDQLIREFPPEQSFTRGRRYPDNTKIHLQAVQALEDPGISPAWKQWISDQLKTETWHDCVRAFGDAILEEYPDFETRFGNFHELGVGTRAADNASTSDISLDAEITIHTPIYNEPCVDRGPHIKTRDKIMVGLLFLRHDDDRSEGGDFELYRVRPRLKPVYGAFQVIDPLFIQYVKTIPYRKNTFVMFLNSPRSVQGMSIRCRTDMPSMYATIPVQLPEPIFDLRYQPDYFDRYSSVICADKLSQSPGAGLLRRRGWQRLREFVRG